MRSLPIVRGDTVVLLADALRQMACASALSDDEHRHLEVLIQVPHIDPTPITRLLARALINRSDPPLATLRRLLADPAYAPDHAELALALWAHSLTAATHGTLPDPDLLAAWRTLCALTPARALVLLDLPPDPTTTRLGSELRAILLAHPEREVRLAVARRLQR